MKTVLLFLCVGIITAYKTYDGYHLIDVTPETAEQVHFLHDLMLKDIKIDFWEEPSKVGKNVRMMLDEDYLKHTMTSHLATNGISYTIFDRDVGESIASERDEIAARRQARGQVFDLDDFNTYADIDTWLTEQLTVCASAGLTCSKSSIGNSFEGREIFLFTVTNAPGTPYMYIDATTHAREWLSPATTFKIIDRLLTTYGSDPEANNFLDNYQFAFVPVVNPDGYSFSWTDERLYRKNRGDNDGSPCIGTDLNRNFDYKWSQNGVSFNPCSDTFCGDSGGSEPETQAVTTYLNSIGSNTWALVTMHSYGYDWMHPWGTTTEPFNDNAPCEIAADHDDMFDVAEAAGQALEAAYGDNWDWGNSCVVIYTTSGATDDYAKGGAGIKYSFTPELRGNGFVVPAGQIEPSAQEVWDALVATEIAIVANPPFARE